jgi:hypothetical protein
VFVFVSLKKQEKSAYTYTAPCSRPPGRTDRGIYMKIYDTRDNACDIKKERNANENKTNE